jgi:DNA-binding transcriptional ArsR family regulator/uncharacterized protein YndB with AHSA1/START domain
MPDPPHSTPPTQALAALSDETRRAILAQLRRGEQAVGQLAAVLPVTRPAVSQHLKVLRSAGLVSERTDGTRHLYRLAPSGLAVVRAYVEELWDVTLDRYASAAQAARRTGGDMPTSTIAPLFKTIVVPLTVKDAFDLFFTRMSTWWPLATHSVYEEGADAVTVDGRHGGHLVEHARDGRAADWGEIREGDPPRRAVFTWHPGYSDGPSTEVEVRFTADGEFTRVDLEHRGWEALGSRAEAARDGYEKGWNTVFAARYGSAALRT